MPMVVVNTNVAGANVPASLMPEISAEFAAAIGKPERYMTVRITPDQKMIFGGTADPCAHCSLDCIGKIDGAQNKKYSEILCGLLKKHLGISADRIYVIFTDLQAANVGWNNTTFG